MNLPQIQGKVSGRMFKTTCRRGGQTRVGRVKMLTTIIQHMGYYVLQNELLDEGQTRYYDKKYPK